MMNCVRVLDFQKYCHRRPTDLIVDLKVVTYVVRQCHDI